MGELKKALGGLMLGLLGLPFRISQGVYRALVLTYLWAWFVVPQFGYKPLPLIVAYGLLLVASLFYRYSHAEAEARKTALPKGAMAVDILLSVIQSSMTWGIGWLAHHFFF